MAETLTTPKEEITWNPNKPACPSGEEYSDCQTVGDRAQRGEKIIRVFTDAGAENNLEEYYASDAIADILHLADREGWDLEDILNRAREHHREEK